MEDVTRYRESLETIVQLRAEHPTRSAIEEAEAYLDVLHGIEHVLMRYPEILDLGAVERFLELLLQIKNLSRFIPDEGRVEQLGRREAALRAAAGPG